MTAVAVIAGQGVFAAAFMAGMADMAVGIARFVSMEVVERLFSAAWHRSMVAMAGIVAVINVTIESTRTMEPGTGSKEDSAVKPIGAVIAVWSAVIRRVVKVAVGADWCRSNVYANGDLC